MIDRAEKKRSGWWALAGMVLVSGLLYVGAYYATVGQYSDVSGDYLISTAPLDGSQAVLLEPPFQNAVAIYPYAWMERFFRPMHFIDRKLRPQAWTSTAW